MDQMSLILFWFISIVSGIHGQLSVDDARLVILMDTTNGQAIDDLGDLTKSQLSTIPLVDGSNNGSVSPVGYSGVRMPDDVKHIGLWSPTYSTSDSFLIAFYFKINGANEGQFFSLLTSESSPASLSVGFANGSTLTVYENSTKIAQIQADLIDEQNWNFIAVRWLKQRKMLEIFFNSDGNTVRLMAVVPVQFASLSNMAIALGGGRVNSSHFMNMGIGTEMACFFMFDIGVNGSKCEIAQLPEYCKSQTPIEQCSDPIASPWPKPTFLKGFWPLNSEFFNAEISVPRLSANVSSISPFVEAGYFGPFGILRTSLSAPNKRLIYTPIQPSNVKWTVSFYFCSQGLLSGLFRFYDLNVYVNGISELVVGAYDRYDQFHTIKFPITNQWYFLTITYDRLSEKMDAFLWNDGVHQSMTIDLIEFSNQDVYLGWANGINSYIRPGDHIACLFMYDAVLSTEEIGHLLYTCRTSGYGSVPEIAENTAEFCSLDFLPLKFSATEIGSISNNNSTILLSQSDSPNTPISHFQLNNIENLQNGNWRMEFHISGFNVMRPDSFRLGIIVSDEQDMERFRNSFGFTAWSQSTNDVFALTIIPGSYMWMTSQSSTLTSRCHFHSVNFVEGIKIIVQLIDGVVSVAAGNDLDRYNLKLCNPQSMSSVRVSYNFKTPSVQIVALMNDAFASYIPNNLMNSLNLNLSQFNIKLDSMKIYSVDTSSAVDEIIDANTNILPIPTWTKLSPNRIENLSFENSQGQDNWLLSNVVAIDEGFQFGSSNSLQTLQSKQFVPNATGWRIEARFKANSTVGTNLYFNIGIVDSSVGVQYTSSTEPVNFRGLVWYNNLRVVTYSAIRTINQLETTLSKPSEQCNFQASDWIDGVEIVLEMYGNMLTLAMQKPHLNDTSHCLVNQIVPSISSIIGGGNAIVLLSRSNSSSVTSPVVDVEWLKFYTLEESETPGQCKFNSQLASTTTTTTTPTTTTAATTTTTLPMTTTTTELPTTEIVTTPNISTTATTTQEITTTTVEVKKEPLIKASVSELIPQADFPSTEPMDVNQVLDECRDFASEVAVPPNRNKPTKLEFYFQVSNLHDVNTRDEILSVGGLILLHWNVTTCGANQSTMFDAIGRQQLYVASASQVWLPKLKFQSSATSNIYMKGDNFGDDITVQMSKDETNQILDFWFLIQGKFDSNCKMNLLDFPMDVQKCTIWFELSRPVSLLQIDEDKLFFFWSVNEKGHEWKMKSTSSRLYTRVFGGAKVQGVLFDVEFSRSPFYYILYLALPVLILGVVILATFFMQPHEPDRPGFSLTVVLALYFAQQQVLVYLPVIENGVLLGDYVVQMTVFAASVAILQMFLCYLSTTFNLDRKVCKNRIRMIRFVDILAVAAAICAFVFIHIKVITAVKAKGLF